MRSILLTCLAVLFLATACGDDSESALDLIDDSAEEQSAVDSENSDSAFLNLGVKKKTSSTEAEATEAEEDLVSTLPESTDPASPVVTALEPVAATQRTTTTVATTRTTAAPTTATPPTTRPPATARPATTAAPVTAPPVTAAPRTTIAIPSFTLWTFTTTTTINRPTGVF